MLNPSFAVDEIDMIVVKARKGAILSISEIMKVGRTLRTARKLKKTIDTAREVPLLAETASSLYINEALEITFSKHSYPKARSLTMPATI